MSKYLIEAWVDEGKMEPDKLRGLLEKFANENDLSMAIEIQDRLWPSESDCHNNPLVPLSNNEITDGPLD